jgi:hypothetical protein
LNDDSDESDEVINLFLSGWSFNPAIGVKKWRLIYTEMHRSFMNCLLSATQHHDLVFLSLPDIQQKLRTQVWYCGLPEVLGRFVMYLSTLTIRSWWSQWVVMAACHC